ncbi:MAG: hypothetical protein CVU42_04885 [Chloroflexi bacterium HGW-Chloroflexi-4]|jgi:methyl-accepting chemotaxis protein|nr:MAG: hypothetical protein CVU42_04885 [Chloroflexi bacterium HGW-Chloroflexi-4]
MIRTKLLIGFALTMVFSLLLGVAGLKTLSGVFHKSVGFYELNYLPTYHSQALMSDFHTLRNSYTTILMHVDKPEIVKEQALIIQKATESISDGLAYFQARKDNAAEQPLVQAVNMNWKTYESYFPVLKTQMENRDAAGIKESIQFLTENSEDLLTSLASLVSYELNESQAKQDENLVAYTSSKRLIQLVLSFSILGTVAIAFVFSSGFTDSLNFTSLSLKNLSVGDLNRNMSESMKIKLKKRKDEIGDVSRQIGGIRLYLVEMAEIARQISAGNLSTRVEPKSERDELGFAFTQMSEQLREIISQISTNAAGLEKASNQLSMNAEQTGQATSQISTTISQVANGISQQTESSTKTALSADEMSQAIAKIASGAQEQSKAVNKVSEISNQISTAIQQITENAETGALESSQAAEIAVKGAVTIQGTIRGMQSIKEKVALSAKSVQNMSTSSSQISAIVQTIDDIASQTNLLALNAAIEAARAGENGKGFAVVADEVRKLAERSSTATKEIGTLIGEIQKTVEEAIASMQESEKEVEAGVSLANQSDDALNSITKAAEAVKRRIEDIAKSAQKVNASSQELVMSMDSVLEVAEANTAITKEMDASSVVVIQAIENIASVSEENGAAVEEVSASTEELNAHSQEVASSAQSLAVMAQSLNTLIAQFKLEG